MKKLILLFVFIFCIGFTLPYTAPDNDDVNLVLGTGYTAPDNDDVNLVLGEVIVDSCTYTSGDWEVDCSDNCTITDSIDLGGNDISIIGTGTFITTANISNYNLLHIEGTDSSNICRVTCKEGGCFDD